MPRDSIRRPSVAVIGSGISGLAAAWLLSRRCEVTLYEAASRPGGHSNTVDIALDGRMTPVDTGFIVFNEATYPNLVALFDHLGVATYGTNMSFAASLRGGSMEYSGESYGGLLAQRRNAFRPRFWSMLYDLQRFYRSAPAALGQPHIASQTLGQFLSENGYGAPFVEDHLLPLSAAIWSATPGDILQYPVEAFIRFHDNHGLLKFTDRPVWRTVLGGSRQYVERIIADFDGSLVLDAKLNAVRRTPGGVELFEKTGICGRFDHVVFATHANQALALLADPSPEEHRLLSSFRYSQNEAWLHSDDTLMPRRRAVWASWNFIDEGATPGQLVVSYWMNKLQRLDTSRNVFVTLNPSRLPREETVHRLELYEHPIIDSAALAAQKSLWSLQGLAGTWFCGAHFGSGFHEDGLQSGLAVAESLAQQEGFSDLRRPWRVANESGRIHVKQVAKQPVAG